MTSKLHSVLFILASLITPATRPTTIQCPCGREATITQEQLVTTIKCKCGGVLCVAGDVPVRDVKEAWERRERGFRDVQ